MILSVELSPALALGLTLILTGALTCAFLFRKCSRVEKITMNWISRLAVLFSMSSSSSLFFSTPFSLLFQ